MIRREVPLAGYVSCDTHVHTLTYSGHGDATLDERLVTLAGEGLELPIATDHNVQTDYRPALEASGLMGLLTPVVGNEVTTRVGHFNVFPLDADAQVIDSRGATAIQAAAVLHQRGQLTGDAIKKLRDGSPAPLRAAADKYLNALRHRL